MPQITVGDKTFEATAETRLVLAIKDHGIDILHRCGGNAKCTTCRVTFHVGEPDKMTQAEKERLAKEPELVGKVRLSCQLLCDHDMSVEPMMTVSNSDVDNPGARPEDHITPDPVWVTKD